MIVTAPDPRGYPARLRGAALLKNEIEFPCLQKALVGIPTEAVKRCSGVAVRTRRARHGALVAPLLRRGRRDIPAGKTGLPTGHDAPPAADPS